MHDPRLDKLAEQLASYSLNLKKGEHVLFELQDVPEELGIALIRAARQAGAHPHLRIISGRLQRELLAEASQEQYEKKATHALAEMEAMDAYLAIRGSHNIAETSDVPTERLQLATSLMRPVIDHRVNHTRWCVLRWPNSAMAQMASMSTEAFEDFFFKVCLLDYGALLPGMEALKNLMEITDKVHLKGPGTDLHFSIKGIPTIICGGHFNIPDGEVFTAPVKDSVEGYISFNAPTIYRGISFDGLELHFEKGKIVKAKAEGGKTESLNAILDSDKGARFIGEFALGFNPQIREPIRDILFDEKIAGSFHFTPGQAYEEADNGNRSQIHWDLVSIQRSEYGGGEILFDGEVIRRDGLFLLKELHSLNYENVVIRG